MDEAIQGEVEYIEDARFSPDEGWSYLVKWKNYHSAYNTWEGEEQFDQPETIRDFWKTHSREEIMLPSHNEYLPKESLELLEDNSYELIEKIYPKINDKDIESILGIAKINGRIICEVKVHNYAKPVHIPSKILRKLCPAKLIKYYESKIVGLH